MRDVVIRYEEENKRIAAECEEAKIEVSDLKKHIEIYEEKLA